MSGHHVRRAPQPTFEAGLGSLRPNFETASQSTSVHMVGPQEDVGRSSCVTIPIRVRLRTEVEKGGEHLKYCSAYDQKQPNVGSEIVAAVSCHLRCCRWIGDAQKTYPSERCPSQMKRSCIEEEEYNSNHTEYNPKNIHQWSPMGSDPNARRVHFFYHVGFMLGSILIMRARRYFIGIAWILVTVWQGSFDEKIVCQTNKLAAPACPGPTTSHPYTSSSDPSNDGPRRPEPETSGSASRNRDRGRASGDV